MAGRRSLCECAGGKNRSVDGLALWAGGVESQVLALHQTDMVNVHMQKRLARPERFRLSLFHERGGTLLPLTSRRMWPVKIFLGVVFLITAGIAWIQIDSMRGQEIKRVFDLAFFLFRGFWLLGWSVGVFILGAITVLFVIHGESACLLDGRLIKMPSIGPLLMIC